MRFAEPNMLHFLWLLIPLWLFCQWRYHQRKKVLRMFVDPKMMDILIKGYRPRRWVVKFIMLGLVFACSIIALARPQWGFEWQDIERKGIDILLAVDTSKSMLTQDVAPNRLERTKLAIKELLQNLKGDRIGLMAFAGEAFLMSPLTVDYSGFALSLNDLDVESVPRGGTDLSTAIRNAIRIQDENQATHPVLIIVTDGDNLEGDPLKAAREAKAAGIKIFTVGIGTAAGELIQIEDEDGNSTFLKDANGNFVKSRLNESLLQSIAIAADGFYVKSAGAEFGLNLIYEQELSKYEKQTFETERERRYYERFQWPIVIALMLLIWEACLKLYKMPSASSV
jgi:Ca-activated chloride channel family protein